MKLFIPLIISRDILITIAEVITGAAQLLMPIFGMINNIPHTLLNLTSDNAGGVIDLGKVATQMTETFALGAATAFGQAMQSGGNIFG